MKESIQKALSVASRGHLPDEVLLRAVMGETLNEEQQAHLDMCDWCRGRVNRERDSNPVLRDAASLGEDFWDLVRETQEWLVEVGDDDPAFASTEEPAPTLRPRRLAPLSPVFNAVISVNAPIADGLAARLVALASGEWFRPRRTTRPRLLFATEGIGATLYKRALRSICDVVVISDRSEVE